MTELSPTVAAYRRATVVARDETGTRVLLRNLDRWSLVDLEQGILYPEAKRNLVTSSGIWVDSGLPDIEHVLRRVRQVLHASGGRT
jgi:hypothetical protein